MDPGVPVGALRACLKETKLKPSDIDKVVFVGEPFPNSFVEYFKAFTNALVKTRGRYLLWIKDVRKLIAVLIYSTVILPYIFIELIPQLRLRWMLRDFKGKYVFVPHHMSHLYSAYYASGWKECFVGCFEGLGILKSVSMYHVKNDKWTKISGSSMPDSPGMFYALVTYILGFKPVRHEGKITGLAGFGNPNKAYGFAKSLLSVRDGVLKLNYDLFLKTQAYYDSFKKLPPRLSKYRREDLAAAFQRRLEECLTEVVEHALKKYKVNRIALAGGVVSNVKLNQRIHELPGIQEIYIHPGMGDEGLALGAALYEAKAYIKPNNLYFGSSYSKRDVLGAMKKYKVNYKYVPNIEKEIARLIVEGKVVGRSLGRMEYGPRALGNRSILCQATDPTINATLNHKLKRTEFMPFAPVAMKSMAPKLFKNIKGAEYAASFMTITFDCTPYMKKKCPAVVHVDGTARPQLVEKSQNPSYFKILKEYYKLTRIPAIINTSFNMHEEPIVCSADDVVRSFITGALDYLAIDNYLAWKEGI